jgi:hypothetical protein
MATTQKESPYYVWSIVFEFRQTKLSHTENRALTVVWTRESGSVTHVAKSKLKKLFPHATNIEVIRLFRREIVDVQLT